MTFEAKKIQAGNWLPWTGEFKQCLRKIIQAAVSNVCRCRTETKAERTNSLNEVGPTISLCVGTMIRIPTAMTALVGTLVERKVENKLRWTNWFLWRK